MNSIEQFTDIVNKSLDALGYSKKMVEMRRTAYNNYSDFQSASVTSFDPILTATICGSKREGITGVLQSDVDIMTTLHSVQCTDTPTPATEDVAYVFELDQSGVLPGYTNLRLYDSARGKEMSEIENSLFKVPSKGLYCSSVFFMSEVESGDVELNANSNEFILTNTMRRKPKVGPSLPIEIRVPLNMSSLDTDRVISFPCECSKYLSSWLGRPRKYEWPTQQLIQMVATLDSHVVPVGAKGSEGNFSQWRICYTHAEVQLMQSLNETNWKLYALLRMLKEEEFQFASDVITSYVLKNLVLWMTESTPEELFRPHLLLDRLTQTVRVLRLCISKAFLPSYMIHERNLLHGRLSTDIQTKLLTVLDALIREGRNMVFRCKNLRQNMIILYKNPRLHANKMSSQNNMEEMALATLTNLKREQHGDILNACMTARTLDEYIAAAMPFWIQTFKHPNYRQFIIESLEMVQRGFVRLSDDTHVYQKAIQAIISDKEVFEDGRQLLSDPQITQGLNSIWESQMGNATFQDCIETLVQTLEPLEECIGGSECISIDEVKSMFAAHPEKFLNIQKQLMGSMAKNPEFCRLFAQRVLSAPEGFLKAIGAMFNATDLERITNEWQELNSEQNRLLQRR